MAIFECVGGVSPTGNALPGDVRAGVTFSNEDDIDLVGTFEAQQKTVTSSRSSQIVTPDSGKYLDQVTVNALLPTGTYTPTSRAANIDMGAESNYRYVTTTSVPNSNSGTYTFPANDTGGTKDLGATNTYRYANATNVYNKGKADAKFNVYWESIACEGTGSGNGATSTKMWFYWPTGRYKTLSLGAYHCSGDYPKAQNSNIQVHNGSQWVTLWSNPKTYNDVAGGSWAITNCGGLYVEVGSYGQGQWAKFTTLQLIAN
ncbi:hypothetical protein [Butyrivibrio sp. INlla21]|uniref:hypothetical protein n=1 Tax=Butyrivibrio sp. INlla21 TaxID=1520811 RepID=UPI0008E58A13|nr:hypothetical protein [Butyrivibrio sp. INlla21]SFU33607.1 hypothetical protein SAMN02910342_00129 [Butyrivibrio sp. INlla21]